MEDYKKYCIDKLENILGELSWIRDSIEFDGPGYGSKLDKEAKSIEKKVEKLIQHLEEESEQNA